MALWMRIREHLHELCSEFRRYLLPTYFHDRCERSLHMHLYTMHKRDLLLSLSGFVSSFVLLLFIGLAGPNVTRLQSISAKEIFDLHHLNQSVAQQLLHNGPFLLHSPSLSPYADHLRLWVTFQLDNSVSKRDSLTSTSTASSLDLEEGEAFHKRFRTLLRVIGKENSNSDQTTIIDQINGSSSSLLSDSSKYHRLFCSGIYCQPIQVLHLEHLNFQTYSVEVRFEQLLSEHLQNRISDIEFTFATLNPSFTNLTIWFRFICLVCALTVTFLFFHSLHRHSFINWSLEQKWIAFLLICLLLYNNPLHPAVYMLGSKLPRALETLFQHTFYCVMMLFWLTFFHGIRQSCRTLRRFYAPKLIVIAILWAIAVYTCAWSAHRRAVEPTLDESTLYQSSILMKLFKIIFYTLLIMYSSYLTLLALTAFSELRSIPYFDVRLKLQTFLISFFCTILVLVSVLCAENNSDHEINQPTLPGVPFLRVLPWLYENSSSAAFLSLYSLANLYVCVCAYFYYPSASSMIDSRVVRDNPTLSMINDSDEDVIYGSDVEDPEPLPRVTSPRLFEIKSDSENSE